MPLGLFVDSQKLSDASLVSLTFGALRQVEAAPPQQIIICIAERRLFEPCFAPCARSPSGMQERCPTGAIALVTATSCGAS